MSVKNSARFKAIVADFCTTLAELGVLTRDVVDGHAASRVIGGRPPRAE